MELALLTVLVNNLAVPPQGVIKAPAWTLAEYAVKKAAKPSSNAYNMITTVTLKVKLDNLKRSYRGVARHVRPVRMDF